MQERIELTFMTESVAACLVDNAAPTPPLVDFITDYAKDSNLPWRLGSAHLLNLFEAALEELAEEKQDHLETHQLMDRLADILSKTAIALKGPEPALISWSWHDLPEVAQRLKADSERGLWWRVTQALKNIIWSLRG